MKRNTMLKILNPLLALLLVGQVFTGLCHDELPPATFEWLHAAGGIAVAVAAVLHVVLNGSWVKSNFFPGRPTTKA
jgi:hypothetical protein